MFLKEDILHLNIGRLSVDHAIFYSGYFGEYISNSFMVLFKFLSSSLTHQLFMKGQLSDNGVFSIIVM